MRPAHGAPSQVPIVFIIWASHSQVVKAKTDSGGLSRPLNRYRPHPYIQYLVYEGNFIAQNRIEVRPKSVEEKLTLGNSYLSLNTLVTPLAFPPPSLFPNAAGADFIRNIVECSGSSGSAWDRRSQQQHLLPVTKSRSYIFISNSHTSIRLTPRNLPHQQNAFIIDFASVYVITQSPR